MRSRQLLEEIRAMRIEQQRQLDALEAQREEDRGRYQEDRDRSDQLMRETRDVIGLNKEAFRRSEVAFGDVRAEIQGMTDSLREVREESKAHARALFALIDRLEGGGAAPAG